MTDATARARPPGWWYPWTIVGGLAIVVAVNAVMFYCALATFPGLMMKEDDGAERLYAANAAYARERDRLGWQVALDYDSLGPARIVLAADVSGADGRPIEDLDVVAAFIRPTNGGSDFEAALTEADGGGYRAEVALPLAGQWNLQLTLRRGEDVYRRFWRIYAP